MNITQISKGKKRLIMYAILAIVVAYIGYQMISAYTKSEKTEVSMNYTSSSTNIVSKVSASYNMKRGSGRLEIFKDFSDSTALPFGCVSSFAELSTTDGDPVGKSILVFTYDEAFLNCNEENIVAVRLEDDLKAAHIAKSTVDTENNTVTVETSGSGKWALADKRAIEGLQALRQKYPEYFDLDASKGLEVLVWQMAEESYRCALTEQKNGTKSYNEPLDILQKGTTPEEMKIILASYGLSEEAVKISPATSPVSSYHYEIDSAYIQSINALFE